MRFVYIKPLHLITIIGIMGSGKTTLAQYLYKRYRINRTRYGKVKSVYFQYDKDKIKDFFKEIKLLDAKYCYVVVDDMSFIASTMDKKTRHFMNMLTKIRHLNTQVRHWVIVTVMHYSKATLPFLRLGATKIITSLTSPEEIESLRLDFTTSALWDYYDVYRNNPNGHWILVNWLGNIFITRFKKPTKMEWDIVV